MAAHSDHILYCLSRIGETRSKLKSKTNKVVSMIEYWAIIRAYSAKRLPPVATDTLLFTLRGNLIFLCASWIAQALANIPIQTQTKNEFGSRAALYNIIPGTVPKVINWLREWML